MRYTRHQHCPLGEVAYFAKRAFVAWYCRVYEMSLFEYSLAMVWACLVMVMRILPPQ